MPNRTYALEWISFSKKNLDTANLLFNVNHYEDIIGIEIQQTLEKLLKAVAANENIKIPKEHDLVKLYFTVEHSFIKLEEEDIVSLRIATDYYKEDRYPNPNYSLPSKDEIKDLLDFTENLFYEVCNMLDVKVGEIK